jgi:hypothetical protein
LGKDDYVVIGCPGLNRCPTYDQRAGLSVGLTLSRAARLLERLKKPVPVWLLLVLILVVASAIAGALVAVSILTRPDFRMKPDVSSLTTLVSPAETSLKINVSSINGFAGIVTLSTKTPGCISTVIYTGNSTPVILLGTSGIATIFVYSTNTGNFTMSVTGTSGQISHTFSLSLIVQGIGFSANPDPLSMLHSPGTSTITLTSQNGLSGDLNLSATLGRFTAQVFPTTVYLPEGGNAKATVTLYTDVYSGGAVIEFVAQVPELGQVGFNLNIISDSSLYLASYSFVSSTNATLELNNSESYTITPLSYSVSDAAGDEYIFNYSSFAPNCCPGAPGGVVSPLLLLIGASCPNCSLNGAPFAFSSGKSYTVTLTTTPGYEFIYTIKG